MTSRNSMISIVVSCAFVISGTVPIASAADAFLNKGFMVAEAHQHGEGQSGKCGEGPTW